MKTNIIKKIQKKKYGGLNQNPYINKNDTYVNYTYS